MSPTPKEYVEGFKSYLKKELEKVNDLKQQSVTNRQLEVAEQFREVEKKLLNFIGALDAIKMSV